MGAVAPAAPPTLFLRPKGRRLAAAFDFHARKTDRERTLSRRPHRPRSAHDLLGVGADHCAHRHPGAGADGGRRDQGHCALPVGADGAVRPAAGTRDRMAHRPSGRDLGRGDGGVHADRTRRAQRGGHDRVRRAPAVRPRAPGGTAHHPEGRTGAPRQHLHPHCRRDALRTDPPPHLHGDRLACRADRPAVATRDRVPQAGSRSSSTSAGRSCRCS